MSGQNINLRHKINKLLIWLLIFPFLAAWPFVSAFPVFSLMNSSTVDISTSLDVIFFVFGFWPLAALFFAAFALMYDEARQVKYKAIRGSGPWIGGYAILWTALYIIALIASH